MSMLFSRLKLIGLGFLLGSLFSGCCVATQLPSGLDSDQKAVRWLWIMSGPFSPFAMGQKEGIHAPAVAHLIVLGYLGIPLIFAHAIRPSWITAGMSICGMLLWYSAGFFAVMEALWGN